ncbi:MULTISPECIES: TetR/AcrR family transcriptional regulator [Photobacterium]|uniref:TetR family transcriptional regulator n=1 Tax=Photobacterium halotolerans TaxID=265726 RepID=A0A0F5VC68_9GAMM|nr:MULTISPECIES: TetR/AcrR family transcriptional regulator [Photobacterium]KKC99401.1 TetR family transcriptional regulator [Photobacterium halotolerans]UIP29824.1 TetR/AcrR family transcriptional regulator [Photobacterium sp. TLY01]
MARTKNFDREEKLIQAMELFWQKGYADTSVSDLVECLGINRFSLYNTYTDKATLFSEALEYYLKKVSFPPLHNLLHDKAGYEDIVAYLKRFASLQREQTCGCFMQNALLERAHCDEAVLATGGVLFNALAERFQTAIQNAQEQGEWNMSTDAEHFSHFLVMQMQGIRVLGKARQYELVDNGVGVLLSLLAMQNQAGAKYH